MDVAAVEIDPADADADLPPEGKYLLYQICTDHRAREIAWHRERDCTSFAGDYSALAAPGYRRNQHYRDGDLPFIAKVPVVRKEIGYVQAQLEEAGGFPLLVRSRDGDRTSFVRADSTETFLSLADYVLALGKRLSIQPWVDAKHYARLVVLGGEVISSIEYLSKDPNAYAFKDFDAVVPWECGPEVESLAVRAARWHKLECAAVNIVIDAGGGALIENVVFPFDFRRDQNVTGVNVADRMLAYLLGRYAETRR